ncbi:5-oxoprolinase subunit PxpB [Marinicellulosiphila megalodicopiae]|uniref:5-oxoprolinase subunit PxpB n=1 Tax=Marinicellulosiphila megalodicopiae TaxID=2724896 RepID=UPI003BAE81E7
MDDSFNIEIAGENALIIYFSDEMNDIVFNQVQLASALITDHLSDKIVDIIASYGSILVQFDLLVIDHFLLKTALRQCLAKLNTPVNQTSKIITLPVYYADESGPDLEKVADHAKLSTDEVIKLHQAQIYQVYAIGFAPGFAYLGEVNAKIATPRLPSPRLKVPKGAVAIADQQTAVYPSVSPGGWNIIGLCPVDMFDPNTTPHMPVHVGDQVQFKSITKLEFIELGGNLETVFI